MSECIEFPCVAMEDEYEDPTNIELEENDLEMEDLEEVDEDEPYDEEAEGSAQEDELLYSRPESPNPKQVVDSATEVISGEPDEDQSIYSMEELLESDDADNIGGDVDDVSDNMNAAYENEDNAGLNTADYDHLDMDELLADEDSVESMSRIPSPVVFLQRSPAQTTLDQETAKLSPTTVKDDGPTLVLPVQGDFQTHMYDDEMQHPQEHSTPEFPTSANDSSDVNIKRGDSPAMMDQVNTQDWPEKPATSLTTVVAGDMIALSPVKIRSSSPKITQPVNVSQSSSVPNNQHIERMPSPTPPANNSCDNLTSLRFNIEKLQNERDEAQSKLGAN